MKKYAPLRCEVVSFSRGIIIKIKNLQQLSVFQIQNIELFTQKRRGIFDFSKEQITLHKKITIEHLKQIFEFEHIDVIFENSYDEDILRDYHDNSTEDETDKNQFEQKSGKFEQPDIKISFGKYKDELYKDIPDSYLLWLKKNYKGLEEQNITNEILRRGIKF